MGEYRFGRNSILHIENLESGLAYVAREAMAYGIMDFAIIESHRKKEVQDSYFHTSPQKTKVKWPNSKHNSMPAKAFDAVPYINGKISWNKLHCCVLAGIIQAAAAKLGIAIRWGGNWDMDGEPVTDQDFQDLVHFEVV